MLGAIVRTHRERLGISQEELAARVGVSVRGIRDIEAGRVARPRPSTVRLLADAFALSGAERDRFCSDLLSTRRRRPADPSSLADWPVPGQLPADAEYFVGRCAELHRLTALLDSAAPRTTVVAISGMAGVGKTTLAVHWAHQVADRFPDGKLYVNLRGWEGDGASMAGEEALRTLLGALGVSPARMPVEVPAQDALLRSLLVQRRMLLVLDNARDAEQVRPLLPGTSGCLVLVTSRSRLAGLVVGHGAWSMPLDMLTAAESYALLTRRLGPARLATEPAATAEIIERCARLPLALAVVAARITTEPELRLRDLAAELRSSDGELHPFAGVDPATDLRTLFSLSHGVLTGSAARLFRLLGLHPGAEFTVALAASLAGIPAARVRPVLAELVQASLVTRVGGDRFALHDLIRAYARELVRSTEPDAVRACAEHRMFDHYLGTALASARRLEPSREGLPAWPLGAGVVTSPVGGAASAATWFARELPTLLRVVEWAGVTGRGAHAWRLAWAVTTYLQRSGRWREQVSMQRAALTAARAAADQVGQSYAHRGLARAQLRLARYDLAEAEARSALELSRALDDPFGQARAQQTLAAVFTGSSRHQVAMWHSRQAFVLFRAEGRRGPAAESLNSIAWSNAQLGRYHPARGCARRAIRQLRAVGDRHGEASAWDTLGYAHAHLGDQVAATRCYRRALRLFTMLGDEFLQAEVLLHLGDARVVVGDLSGARAAWRRALSLLDRLGHPGAEALRGRLSG